MRVLDIIPGTSVDGPGLRTSVYFAGCRHSCPGCHNPQSWDFNSGHDMTVQEVMATVRDNGFNVTFSGGDPVFQLGEAAALAKAVKSEGYNLWLYTGYVYEKLLLLSGIYNLLRYVDVVVDGPFIESLRDISLRFRGSSNQRIIDVQKSFITSDVVLWHD